MLCWEPFIRFSSLSVYGISLFCFNKTNNTHNMQNFKSVECLPLIVFFHGGCLFEAGCLFTCC